MAISTASTVLDALLCVLVLFSIVLMCVLWYWFVHFLAWSCSKVKVFLSLLFPTRRRSFRLCERIFLLYPRMCDDPSFMALRAQCPNGNTLFVLFALTVICLANTFSKRLSRELYLDVHAFLILQDLHSRAKRFHESFVEICYLNALGEIQTLDGFTGWLDESLEEFVTNKFRQSVIVSLLRYAALALPDPSRVRLHGRLDFS